MPVFVQVFCLEHRSYKSHECQKPDIKSRKVVVCEACSVSIETTGCDEEGERVALEKHVKSGKCDPKKQKKPTCPVRRCKEVLTFSNTSTCKTCDMKVCLKHRFPADHACKGSPKEAATVMKGWWSESFLAAFAARNGKDCARGDKSSTSKSSRPPSVKAY